MSVSKTKRNKRLKVKLDESDGKIHFLRTALAHLYLTANGIVRELADPSEVSAEKKLKAIEEWEKAVDRYINVPKQASKPDEQPTQPATE